jgi:hypothetical protein
MYQNMRLSRLLTIDFLAGKLESGVDACQYLLMSPG